MLSCDEKEIVEVVSPKNRGGGLFSRTLSPATIISQIRTTCFLQYYKEAPALGRVSLKASKVLGEVPITADTEVQIARYDDR